VDQLTEFVTNNLILFAALFGVLIMLIKAELDHQTNKGLFVSPAKAIRLMNNEDDALIIDTIKLLKAAGFEKVNNLEGGIAAWKEANMPLSKK